MNQRDRRCVWPLICPVCRAPLERGGGTLRCDQGHAFDLAREGYVNLLLPGRRRPPVLGDTKTQLRARRRFLDRGWYRPLADALSRKVGAFLSSPPRHRSLETDRDCVVDVGCGEGYYTGRLGDTLGRRASGEPACVFGMDVSKEAARMGARRYPGVQFVVASVRHTMPFATGTVRVLINVFAPRSGDEFARIVQPGGLLLVVLPESCHLASLRDRLDLLGIEPDKEQHVVDLFAASFRLLDSQVLTFGMALEGQDLVDLVQMTPNYWHWTADTSERVRQMGRIETEASFTVLTLERAPHPP